MHLLFVHRLFLRRLDMLSACLFLMLALPAMAGKADVTDVSVRSLGAGKWLFDVTVRHDDTGWEHYADRWEVVGPDGTILGTRLLAHPHVDEQPFTRSGEIAIPETVSEVTVRANDSVHGLGGTELKATLPR